MRIHKNLFACLALLFCCVLQFHVYAQETEKSTEPNVTIASAVVEPKGTVEVSVFLKDNPGIMGMGLEVYYDKNLLKAEKVLAGEAYKNGTFNSSSTSENSGEIKILWSSTGNVDENGEFCRVTFRALSEVEDSTDLSVALLPEDTFNEKWENVSFSTCDGVLQIKSTWTENEKVTNVVQKAEEKENGKEEIYKNIEKCVAGRDSEKTDYNDLSETDKEVVADDVIDDLKKKKLLKEDMFSDASVDEKIDFVSKLQKETNPDAVYKVVEYASMQKDAMLKNKSEDEANTLMLGILKDYGVDKVEDIPTDQRTNFLNRFLQILQENGIEQSEFWMQSTTEDQIETVTMLMHDLSGDKSLDSYKKDIDKKNKGNLNWIYLVIGGVLLLICLLAITINKGKNGGTKNAKKRD